jgi:hypothetical protein
MSICGTTNTPHTTHHTPHTMTADVQRQTSSQDPAQPSYVFRGHTAPIHSVHLVRQNTCLVTGDADGWVVYWRFESKRPMAVWQAHEGAILGTAEWGPDKLITCVVLLSAPIPSHPTPLNISQTWTRPSAPYLEAGCCRHGDPIPIHCPPRPWFVYAPTETMAAALVAC